MAEGKNEKILTGRMSNACPEDPSFRPLMRRPTGGQAILVTGPRGGFTSAPTSTAAGGWQHQQRACHSQTETGRSVEGGGEQAASVQLHQNLLHLSSFSSHHWKLSRELRGGLPPPPSRRSIGKAVSVSHTPPLL